jgi:PAS domain S-box-containing protein
VPTGNGLGVYFRDITQHREIQATLRASEERFERIAEATTDAMWDWDLITDELWWSPGLQRIFGYELDSAVTPSSFWSNRIHPDDMAAVKESVHAAFNSNVTHWAMEYRFQRSDGRYVWVSDHASIVRAAGAAVRMVGGFSDITAQREAKERLLEQAQLLDKARDAIHVRELDNRIVYVNRSAEELYGWPAAEAIGRSMERLVYRDSTAFRNAHQALMAHGEWTGEMEVVSRDGRRLLVETRWTLLRDGNGSPRRILAIDTDVTERRELERQVMRSQRLDSIGTLAGGIAHDLNNVFTPITMAVNLMRSGAIGTEERALLDAIATSADRGVQMVGRLLSFARGAEGVRQPVRVADVVDGVVKIMSETFPKNIVPRVDIEPGLPSVVGDPTQLHQVLLNLCVNARDAMPRGGEIRITVQRRASAGSDTAKIAIDVADTGSGIDPEHMDRLWDPFFSTKAVGRGTGLGLPTSLAIVKAHGGEMRVHSIPGIGSTFCILLPAGPPLERRDGAPVANAVPQGAGQRILVVDDEEPVRRICRQALERHGYRVTEAADGREALQAYRRDPRAYDLVLVDMMMPVMDGAQTIEALRRLDPEVRIVPTSGYTNPDRMAAVQAAGLPHFLPKPYTPETLLRVIAAGLGS